MRAVVVAIGLFATLGLGLAGIACGTLLDISPDDNADAASEARDSDSNSDSSSNSDGGVEGAVDAGNAEASAEGSADAGVDAAPPRYVFVAGGYPNGYLGGLSGADAICNMQAMNAGLPGTYKAWLSTATVSAVDRLADGSWMRPDGILVFASRQDIIAGKAPLQGINRSATNTVTSGNLWTGTSSTGVTTGTTCDGWTAFGPGMSGTQGQIGTTSTTWTNATSQPCNNMGTFLCFGTP